MIATAQSKKSSTSHVISVAKFQRFFQTVASPDVDKEDLKCYSDFINHKFHDLLLRGEATAKANSRVFMGRSICRLPTAFRNISRNSRSRAKRSTCGRFSNSLPRARRSTPMAKMSRTGCRRSPGGLSVALARTFGIIDANLKNPASEHWPGGDRIISRCFALVWPNRR